MQKHLLCLRQYKCDTIIFRMTEYAEGNGFYLEVFLIKILYIQFSTEMIPLTVLKYKWENWNSWKVMK